MAEQSFPTGDALDRVAAPFYHALGRAFTRWQHVESSLFVLTHGLMDTDYKVVSTVFFHIKSADSKLELIERLCLVHFDAKVLKEEWTPLRKRIKAGLGVRNAMAHFEVNFITDPRGIEAGEPPIILTPHHLDHRSMAKGEVPGATAKAIDSWGKTYLELTREILKFVGRHFQLQDLRANNLPPRLLQTLERYQKQP